MTCLNFNRFICHGISTKDLGYLSITIRNTCSTGFLLFSHFHKRQIYVLKTLMEHFCFLWPAKWDRREGESVKYKRRFKFSAFLISQTIQYLSPLNFSTSQKDIWRLSYFQGWYIWTSWIIDRPQNPSNISAWNILTFWLPYH